MCILSYIPAGVEAVSDDLRTGGINNSDGHGFAIAVPEQKRVHTGHSMDIDEAVEMFERARSVYKGDAIFHSRFATHGSIKLENCHPFKAGHSDRTYVAHNGILPKSAQPVGDDDRSDSKIFAEDILPRWYKRLDRKRVQNALANWAGAGNKLAIITVDPRYQHNAYIVNMSKGTWDKTSGVWHSNHDYQYVYKTYSVGSYGNVWNSKYWNDPKDYKAPMTDDEVKNWFAEHCWRCEGDLEGNVTTCPNPMCYACQDCGEYAYGDCQCWQREKMLETDEYSYRRWLADHAE